DVRVRRTFSRFSWVTRSGRELPAPRSWVWICEIAFWIAALATFARHAGYAFATAFATRTTRSGFGPVALKEIVVPFFETCVAFSSEAGLPIEPPLAFAACWKSWGEFASAFSVWSTRFGSTYCDDPEKSCDRSVGARMTCECATYCLPWLWRTRSNMTAP